MSVRGIRGAITVTADEKQLVLEATYRLLSELQNMNRYETEDIVSVLFTVTPDIKSAFPAEARRLLPGWNIVPLMCFQEIEVKNALPLCIRVLIHINTDKKQNEIKHIYLEEAVKLRKDLAN